MNAKMCTSLANIFFLIQLLTNALSCTLTSKFRTSKALSNRLDPDVQAAKADNGAILVVISNLK